jgi:glycerol-3-phosphate dehydrogenase (NAD(P)+)
MKFGIIGSGSWGTALAKILTDNKNKINWWLRSDSNISIFKTRRHNPHYLRSAFFDTSLINFSTKVEDVIRESDCILIVVPSAFAADSLSGLPKSIFENK